MTIGSTVRISDRNEKGIIKAIEPTGIAVEIASGIEYFSVDQLQIVS